MWAAHAQCCQPLLPAGSPYPCGSSALAAELGRFTADADTAPGFRKRYHNRSTLKERTSPGVVVEYFRRDTETGSQYLEKSIRPYMCAAKRDSRHLKGENQLKNSLPVSQVTGVHTSGDDSLRLLRASFAERYRDSNI